MDLLFITLKGDTDEKLLFNDFFKCNIHSIVSLAKKNWPSILKTVLKMRLLLVNDLSVHTALHLTRSLGKFHYSIISSKC